jgi:hypothetical protein
MNIFPNVRFGSCVTSSSTPETATRGGRPTGKAARGSQERPGSELARYRSRSQGLQHRPPDLSREKLRGPFKDYEFSRLSMDEHWRVGYHDARSTLRHPQVLERPKTSKASSPSILRSTAVSGEHTEDAGVHSRSKSFDEKTRAITR